MMDAIIKDELSLRCSSGIEKDQNNIFLSATMTGNLQLLRLGHIGYFRYSSKNRQWEAVLSNQRSLMLKRSTNSQMILSYHPYFIQISQSFIVNVEYLVLIRDNKCVLLSPFDKVEDLQISAPFLKKLKEKYLSI